MIVRAAAVQFHPICTVALRRWRKSQIVVFRRRSSRTIPIKAITIEGRTVMVPVHTGRAASSPFVAHPSGNGTVLERDGVAIARVAFPPTPRFYALSTFDGIPYWKIASLHGRDDRFAGVHPLYEPADALSKSLPKSRTRRCCSTA